MLNAGGQATSARSTDCLIGGPILWGANIRRTTTCPVSLCPKPAAEERVSRILGNILSTSM